MAAALSAATKQALREADALAFLSVFKVGRCRYADNEGHMWHTCPFWHASVLAVGGDQRRLECGQPANATEALYHPRVFRTQMCAAGVSCPFPATLCPWAHRPDQLRKPCTMTDLRQWWWTYAFDAYEAHANGKESPDEHRPPLVAGGPWRDPAYASRFFQAVLCCTNITQHALTEHVLVKWDAHEWSVRVAESRTASSRRAFHATHALLRNWAAILNVSLLRPRCADCGQECTVTTTAATATAAAHGGGVYAGQCTGPIPHGYCVACVRKIITQTAPTVHPAPVPCRPTGTRCLDTWLDLSPAVVASVWAPYIHGVHRNLYAACGKCFDAHLTFPLASSSSSPSPPLPKGGDRLRLCPHCHHYTCAVCDQVLPPGDWNTVGTHLALCSAVGTREERQVRKLCQWLSLLPDSHWRRVCVQALHRVSPLPPHMSAALRDRGLWLDAA